MTDKDPAREAAKEIEAACREAILVPKPGNSVGVEQVASIIRRHFADALEDGKRLDWLELNGAQTWCNFTEPDAFSVQPALADFSFKETYHGGTLRAAIDSARTDEGEGRDE